MSGVDRFQPVFSIDRGRASGSVVVTAAADTDGETRRTPVVSGPAQAFDGGWAWSGGSACRVHA